MVWTLPSHPTRVVSFIDTLIEYHLWVAMNLFLHLVMLDLSMCNVLLAK